MSLQESAISVAELPHIKPAEVLKPNNCMFEITRKVVEPKMHDAKATFNGCRLGDLVMYRVKLKPPEEGDPDITDYYGIRMLLDNQSILYGKALQKDKVLPKEYSNLEDPRSFEYTGQDNKTKAIIGFTAVESQYNVPFPAIVEAEAPYGEDNFSNVHILDYLPAGKNVCPIAKDVFIYREEGQGGKIHHLTVVKKEGDKWNIKEKIPFPKDLDWANFRIGLTGGQWVKKDKHTGRLFIHGVNQTIEEVDQGIRYKERVVKVNGTKVSSPIEEDLEIIENFENAKTPGATQIEKYKYGLGLMDLEWDGDFENIRLVGISEKPILTYEQMGELFKSKFPTEKHERLNGNKEVIYTDDGGKDVKGMRNILMTYEDNMIVEISAPLKTLQEMPLQKPKLQESTA